MKKSAYFFVALVLMLGMAGCKNSSVKGSSQTQTGSGQTQSSAEQTSQSGADNSSGEAAAGDSAGSGKDGSKDGTAPSQMQQDVLKKTKAALNTNVPLMMPTSVPVEDGRYLTSTTASQATSYKVNFYENDQPSGVNSKAASNGTLLATVEGIEYKDTSSAKEKLSGYVQEDISKGPDSVDLGHHITAVQDAGMGHLTFVWNEGRWCIKLDSPNDPAYKNKEYPDSQQLAKDVVAYLDDSMLPVPQNIGVIRINNWNKSYGATVQWQYNQTVYQISSQDPMTALKVAVAMKFN